MSKRSPAAPKPALSRGEFLLVRLCLLLALGISLFLAWNSLKGGGVPGCGPDSDCDRVLSSRWAYLFGLPVSLFAAPVYAATLGLLSLRTLNWKWISALSALIIAAALWFGGLQFFVIRAFCKFCMAAHVAGLIAAITLLRRNPMQTKPAFAWGAAGVAATILLAAGQSISKPPQAELQTYEASASQTPPPAASTSPSPAPAPAPAPSTAPGTNSPAQVAASATASNNFVVPASNTMAVVQGQFVLDLAKVPMLGSRTAGRKVVKLFDYTCHHCRDLHLFLEDIFKKYPDELAVISLPMPLDANCNLLVKRTPSQHVNACEYAKLGLAVHFAVPEKLHAFDDYIYKPERPPALGEARQFAASLIGKDIDAAMADPRVMQQLNEGIQIYAANSRLARKTSMPQLIFTNGTMIGSIRSVEHLEQVLDSALQIKARTAAGQ